MSDTHILKTSVGITIEGRWNPETMQLICQWSPAPPYSRRRFKRLLPEYLPWRDGIIQAAVDTAGLRVLVLTPDGSGGIVSTCFEPREAHV